MRNGGLKENNEEIIENEIHFSCFTPVTPIATTPYDTCIANAVNLCVNAKINSLGIVLLPKPLVPERHLWDLRHVYEASLDCQTCIRSIIGPLMSADTLRSAQCDAYDTCNQAAG